MRTEKSKERKRRSWKRRFLFSGVVLFLLYAFVEVCSFLAFQAIAEEGFSFSRLDSERTQLASLKPEQFQNNNNGTRNADFVFDQVIHPYLGYSYPPGAGKDFNRFGLHDGRSPIQKRSSDKLIIGITGGSVSYFLAENSADVLIQELRRVPAFENKEILVLRMGMGGYKQPQQLMTLNYLLSLGAEFDIVINIDGFNEVALAKGGNFDRGTFPFYPIFWDLLVNSVPSKDFLRRVGQITIQQEARRDWAERMSGFPWSRMVCAQFLWKYRDRTLHAGINKQRQELQALENKDLPPAARGPGTIGFTPENIWAKLAEMWGRCSVQMHRTCEANGIKYLHFLQPNQYVKDSKPMSAEERKVAILEQHAYRTGVELGYPELARRGKALTAEGVGFHDLRMIFEDIDFPVYLDNCCHFNKTANDIMARRMAKEILRRYEHKTAVLVGMRAQSAALSISDPTKPAALKILGRFADNTERLISGAHAGTRYVSSKPSTIRVLADGRLIALREGTAVITIRNGEFRAAVEVTAKWQSVITYGTGKAGSSGIVPRLSASEDKAVRGNKNFKLEIDGGLGGSQGVLLLFLEPPQLSLHRSLSGQLPKVLSFPIVLAGSPGKAGAGSLILPLPIPDDVTLRGGPTFWSCILRDPGSATGFSATNDLVITAQ